MKNCLNVLALIVVSGLGAIVVAQSLLAVVGDARAATGQRAVWRVFYARLAPSLAEYLV